ncbi:FAD binding domain-containing protein [Burkholderia ubonensis]|uniref:2,6-dihydroxypyridine 3-monooxygenase substrate binding domain-containing protein n=1 Tax=Burkholderia ubonensis subsp. mesacidophila TaxID=265293 RepID=A0A2A4FK60_9BURK|nr:hypothetical protein [Burkholderia ubonensis]PCE33457.1 hypothetical protein BZL54_04340 [Burkholderia ubonensis subsp. mesacidophila]
MKIAIAGGSIAGLSAALTLNCIGHDVCVYERADHARLGHGGGVAVLRPMMAFLEAHGPHGHYSRAMLGVPTRRRRWIDRDGRVVGDAAEWLPFSSWDVVYRSLCAMLPDGLIRYGSPVTCVSHDAGGVDVLIGSTLERVDLLVAAEGTGSGIRTALFPDCTPVYAGYIAWRGVVDEAAFAPGAIDALVENLTLHRQPGELFMAFLMPALDGSRAPRTRRFNWIWYRNEPDDDRLRRYLTDADGRPHHASVGPGRLSAESAGELARLAHERLPAVLSQLVAATGAPFVQAISDLLSPAFADGRIVLAGDAACTLRPHTASGTSKAAADAVALAQALPPGTGDVAQRVAGWAAARRAAAIALADTGVRLAAGFGLGSAHA